MARVRGGTGLITVEMASPEKRRPPSPPRARHLRRPLPSRAHAAGAAKSIAAAPRRRSSSAMAAATPASTSAARRRSRRRRSRIRSTRRRSRPSFPEAMSKARIAQTIAAHVAAAVRAQRGRLRLRRNPRRARLPDLAISRAVREPPHRRIWRQPRKPRPLRPRRAARREGGGAGMRRHLPALGRGLLSRRPAVTTKAAQIAIWAAQAGADALHITAGHYRSLPSAQIVLPPMSIPDATFLDFAADVKQAGQRAGDRGRPARRSGDRGRRRSQPARPISSRSAAR